MQDENRLRKHAAFLFLTIIHFFLNSVSGWRTTKKRWSSWRRRWRT
jgi:hypothetical protein